MSTPEFDPDDHPRGPGGQFALKHGSEAGDTGMLDGRDGQDDLDELLALTEEGGWGAGDALYDTSGQDEQATEPITHLSAVRHWRENYDRVVAKIDAGEPTHVSEKELLDDLDDLLNIIDDDLDREKTFDELVEQEEQVTRQLVHKAVDEIEKGFHRITGKDLRYMDLARNYDEDRSADLMAVEQLTADDGTVYADEWGNLPSDSNEDDFATVTEATYGPASALFESRLYFLKHAEVSDDGHTVRVDVSKVG